jgi:hypothetical protein
MPGSNQELNASHCLLGVSLLLVVCCFKPRLNEGECFGVPTLMWSSHVPYVKVWVMPDEGVLLYFVEVGFMVETDS